MQTNRVDNQQIDEPIQSSHSDNNQSENNQSDINQTAQQPNESYYESSSSRHTIISNQGSTQNQQIVSIMFRKSQEKFRLRQQTLTSFMNTPNIYLVSSPNHIPDPAELLDQFNLVFRANIPQFKQVAANLLQEKIDEIFSDYSTVYSDKFRQMDINDLNKVTQSVELFTKGKEVDSNIVEFVFRNDKMGNLTRKLTVRMGDMFEDNQIDIFMLPYTHVKKNDQGVYSGLVNYLFQSHSPSPIDYIFEVAHQGVDDASYRTDRAFSSISDTYFKMEDKIKRYFLSLSYNKFKDSNYDDMEYLQKCFNYVFSSQNFIHDRMKTQKQKQGIEYKSNSFIYGFQLYDYFMEHLSLQQFAILMVSQLIHQTQTVSPQSPYYYQELRVYFQYQKDFTKFVRLVDLAINDKHLYSKNGSSKLYDSSKIDIQQTLAQNTIVNRSESQFKRAYSKKTLNKLRVTKRPDSFEREFNWEEEKWEQLIAGLDQNIESYLQVDQFSESEVSSVEESSVWEGSESQEKSQSKKSKEEVEEVKEEKVEVKTQYFQKFQTGRRPMIKIDESSDSEEEEVQITEDPPLSPSVIKAFNDLPSMSTEFQKYGKRNSEEKKIKTRTFEYDIPAMIKEGLKKKNQNQGSGHELQAQNQSTKNLSKETNKEEQKNIEIMDQVSAQNSQQSSQSERTSQMLAIGDNIKKIGSIKDKQERARLFQAQLNKFEQLQKNQEESKTDENTVPQQSVRREETKHNVIRPQQDDIIIEYEGSSLSYPPMQFNQAKSIVNSIISEKIKEIESEKIVSQGKFKAKESPRVLNNSNVNFKGTLSDYSSLKCENSEMQSEQPGIETQPKVETQPEIETNHQPQLQELIQTVDQLLDRQWIDNYQESFGFDQFPVEYVADINREPPKFIIMNPVFSAKELYQRNQYQRLDEIVNLTESYKQRHKIERLLVNMEQNLTQKRLDKKNLTGFAQHAVDIQAIQTMRLAVQQGLYREGVSDFKLESVFSQQSLGLIPSDFNFSVDLLQRNSNYFPRRKHLNRVKGQVQSQVNLLDINRVKQVDSILGRAIIQNGGGRRQ